MITAGTLIMKTTILATIVAFVIQASAAEAVLEGDLEQQELSKDQSWKIANHTAACIQIPNKWPSLRLSLILEANTFYRVSYEYRLQDGTEKDSLCVDIGKKRILQHTANAEWSKTAGYFYNEKNGKQIMQISLDGPAAFRAWFRNLKIEKLDPEDLKTITVDFNDNAGPAPAFFYKHSPKSTAWDLTVVPVDDFVEEGNALCITSAEDMGCKAHSHTIPLELDKNFQLTFWAKAKKSVTASVCVDGYLRGAEKHFYRSAKYPLTEEWKQFTLEFKSPTEKEHPQMAKRTIHIILTLPKSSSAKFKKFVLEQK